MDRSACSGRSCAKCHCSRHESTSSGSAAVGGYAVGTVLVVVLVMIFLLWRATSANIVATRREAARPMRRPLWRRLNLDVGAASIALTGYGVSVYLASIGTLLDARTKALVSAPLTLVAPIFLLIGALIVFLRFFPTLLQLGERLVARRREATSMLAVAQMARSPRQAGRMILLLALTIAFAIFTLVFAASQAQHISDVAAYEVGADFSGDLPVKAQPLPVVDETAIYDHISGVTSATVGYTSEGISSGVSPALPMQILAVDANTFAHTAIWTPQDASQPLASLMAQLIAERQDAVRDDAVPAIVDAATMHRLDLQVGNHLTITLNALRYTTLDCVVVAKVEHIPTVNDGNETGSVGGSSSSGGVLLDFTTYAAVYKQDVITSGAGGDLSLPINHIWIRTKGDSAALAHVRAALMTPELRLDNLYDRGLLLEIMRADPLYLSLLTILAVGAATAMLLALGGDLLASWLSARTRLTSFAVLRSLGATPRQITGVLLWEQGIIYAAALLLGVIFGSVLSATAVPALTLSITPAGSILSGNSVDEFYVIQQALPTQIVLPLSLGLAFIVLAAVCVLALGTISGVVLHPSMSQTLRLNED